MIGEKDMVSLRLAKKMICFDFFTRNGFVWFDIFTRKTFVWFDIFTIFAVIF